MGIKYPLCEIRDDHLIRVRGSGVVCWGQIVSGNGAGPVRTSQGMGPGLSDPLRGVGLEGNSNVYREYVGLKIPIPFSTGEVSIFPPKCSCMKTVFFLYDLLQK